MNAERIEQGTGKASLFIDGKKAGQGDIGTTLAIIFPADDGYDVGEDERHPRCSRTKKTGEQPLQRDGEEAVLLSFVEDDGKHEVELAAALALALARQ